MSIAETTSTATVEITLPLLAGTELLMANVAGQAGFSDSRHLSVVFRQETGLTPTAYRRQFRGPSEVRGEVSLSKKKTQGDSTP